MPTATMTDTLNPQSIKQSSQTTSIDTKSLRTLYNRAAKAFLKRNISLTHSLLQLAFSTLSPGSDIELQRKWDILRITFETTVYTSGVPPSASSTEFPDQLKDITLKSPQNLVTEMYNRSLALFSPRSIPVSSVVLPVQVLSTLVYSSLKLDAPQVGRDMIEDWLGRRGSSYYTASPQDGYDKILELYVLHVLPKLEEWEYAIEFMEYESQLDVVTRGNLQNALRTHHAQTLSARLLPQGIQNGSTSLSPLTSRPQSPTPSSSSSSSSLSTTSTHTAVPATPRPHHSVQHSMSSLSSLDSSVSSSSSRASSEGTITPNKHTIRGKGKAKAEPEGNGHPYPASVSPSINDTARTKSHSPARSRGSGSSNASPRTSTTRLQHTHPLNPNSMNPLSIPRTHFVSSNSSRGRNLGTYALIKASLQPYLARLSGSRGAILTGMFLFFVLPVISVSLRLRSKRRIGGGVGTAGTADIVRRRLRGVNGSDRSGIGMMIAKLWWAIVRAVLDTVRMGVSGLV
ncbi:hypothetical protein Moror_12909 [Moniliophthora roreri MCA 2997]|uniref:Uncharacterized protein n=2 Tax=Moniliophthora roreri TaxID=221103 RepID=V2XNC4_MONRO|nr:hypothetical protein Moror_12909 [Moniliophthora roreri MCA 2997]KAI3607785.1 hypothetical protein WG66_004899 [Moniliophthora roreri]